MSLEERWNTPDEFPDYEVSSHGSVWDKRKRNWVNTEIKRGGIYVNIDNQYDERVCIALDRLVAMTFLGGDQPNRVIKHKDGHRQNNHADNLEWVLDLNRPMREIYSTLPVRCVETGEIYDNIYECSEYLGVKPSAIYKCITIKGLAVTSHRLHFEWTD